MNAGSIYSGGSSMIRPEFAPDPLFLGALAVVADPRRLQQGQALHAVAVAGSERRRGGPAARVTDEMEALEPRHVGRTQDTVDLDVERVVRRQRLTRVDLEVLRDHVDVIAGERLKQRPVGELSGQHAPWNEDRMVPHA